MSGGHFPSYNHIQPPQDFIAPRHRLPAVPASGPTAPYGSASSISNAHASHTSWMKNRNYGPNYSANSAFYTQSAPRNYSPVSRAQSKEESSWPVTHFANSPAVGNPSFRDSNLTDGMEPKNMSSKDDMQQESMDLSASHTSPADETVKPNQEYKTSVNGDTSETGQPEDKAKSNVNRTEPDETKEIPSLKPDAVVNVIAPNPLKTRIIDSENSVKPTSKSSLCDVALVPEAKQVPCDVLDPAETSRTSTIPSDNVESALETMFHSEVSPVSSSCSSVIVTAHSCKIPKDLRAESVEKILKSPSPTKGDDDNSVEGSSRVRKFSFTSLENEESRNSLIATENSSNLKTPPSSEVELTDGTKEAPLNCCKIEISKATVRSATSTAASNNDPSDANTAESNEGSTPKVEDEKLSAASLSVIVTTNNVSSSEKRNVESELGKLLLARPRTKGECKTFETEVKQETNNTVTATNEESPSKRRFRNEEITYVEVESELEKMFAGIEDGEVNGSEMDPLNNLQVISSAGEGSSQHDANLFCNSTSATKSSKKKNSKKLKSNMSKGSKDTKMKSSTSVKENSFDNILARRLPVIHVEGSKENPISTQIINSIKSEDDDVSDGKTGAKRKLPKNDIGVKRSAASYVVKNYDPGTSDASWICVFCQLCAYSPGIDGEPTGDLFGPYFIKYPHAEDESKRHSRKENHMEQVKKKQKRSSSAGNDYFDPSTAEDQKLMEIWAHENCIVWASGVHLIGSKLIGLEEAVLEAMETTCAHCSNTGASIGCKARHCKCCVHYSCALFTGWKLDLDTFVATCSVHRVPD